MSFNEDSHLCELYEVLDYTIGGLRNSFHTHLLIKCRNCRHTAEPRISELSSWKDHWHLGDLARHLVCTAVKDGKPCGARFPKIEAYRFRASFDTGEWRQTGPSNYAPTDLDSARHYTLVRPRQPKIYRRERD